MDSLDGFRLPSECKAHILTFRSMASYGKITFDLRMDYFQKRLDGQHTDNTNFLETLQKVFRVRISPEMYSIEKDRSSFYNLEAETNDYYCLYTCLMIAKNKEWLSNMLGRENDNKKVFFTN